jgi:hypothetical protein
VENSPTIVTASAASGCMPAVYEKEGRIWSRVESAPQVRHEPLDSNVNVRIL